jgi:hypothetical protein
MKIIGMNFRRPRFGELIGFALSFLIVFLTVLGVSAAIHDGDIKNNPQLLQALVFYPFTLAICLRLCWMLGFANNKWPGRILMFTSLYVPTWIFFHYVCS